MRQRLPLAGLAILAGLASQPPAQAQPGGPRPPDFASPEVSAEKKVTFRVFAPKAAAVKLASSDIPGNGPDAAPGMENGGAMKKRDDGVWEAVVGPVQPGAYRYRFDVDGVAVVDPRNTATSETNSDCWSLVYVPGSDASDTKDVPHGAVAEVTYSSKTLGRPRRMHVYTPPGYEKGEGKYPVFYLLHGAFDCDDSWSTVGRAEFILDNLIAAGKAKPMVVVMPAGHTGPFRFGAGGDNSFERQMQEFEDDFVKDVKPLVESRYRVLGDRANRAIAGLSMGGAQTLNIAGGHLGEFGYVGVFSSGIFGITGGFNGAPPDTKWEESHKSILDDAELKKGLKLVWFGCGKDDFLVKTSEATVEMLKRHGFAVTSRESEGGHTWTNWRLYLSEFAPQLFQEK
ncbi:Carbohydrate acetyl esterase/feruloyl esterase precursor [Aquisphaera giovannonii]|uniref:Carbohydrate acetyl esterase/feruloyl esterase n=1 Tax=Aquisphaera giovannonii TaxID=406548 RepID=A0A5B9VX84_9BACT|nr:esterase [Aquisphaera giovannonii]QEH32729.1 Carbohydrate acetyl esterase/feruloyl esterase precursor [Aquisphaera giovannonii]